MRRRTRCLSVGLIAIAFLCGDSQELLSQDTNNEAHPEIVQLSPPKYPPLPRTARISGDVKLELQLRTDGTVSSVRVLSGHPLLAPAAVESAKASRFVCYSCVLPTTYIFTYTFGFREDSDCSVVKLRAPKCLYLWGCGMTFYKNEYRPRAQVIIQSKDHITVGVDSFCIETETANTRKR
jgi:TonB family protein